MRRVSTTTRISIALAALSVSILLIAHAMGLVPDALDASLQGRKALCEAIALHSSAAVFRGETDAVRSAIEAIVERNKDVISAGIRSTEGSLLVEVGDHRDRWKPPSGDASTPTHVRVPIYKGEVPWGTVEIHFKPLSQTGWRGFVSHPLFRLTAFLAASCMLAYVVYLRKALQYLDPSLVIPDRVKTMLDTLAEGVVILDKEERIVLANEVFARTMARKADDLVGKSPSKFGWVAPAADPAAPDYPWLQALRDNTVHAGVALCLRRGNETQTFTVNAAPITGGRGVARGVLVTFDDVTPIERKNVQLHNMLEMLKQSRDEINRQNQELQMLAMTDPLTGCLNRRAFFTRFEAHWGGAKRYGHVVSCVMVDVDRFKRINDEHGHGTGDQVLQHVASILKSLARDSDEVCRYGGEEFCVLLTNTDLNGALQAGERFRATIESSSCGGISLTASFGVSSDSLGARTPQELLNQADEALYAAKRGGRNRVEQWTPALVGGGMKSKSPDADRRDAAPPPQPTRANESSIPFRAVSALLSVLAHRDKETAAHSARVADLCVAVAHDLLPVSDCFVLEVAALLHDIGKLGVPDSILLKPAALDDEEWKIMRKHDRMGAEIVAAAFGSEQLTRIVQTHHAWYGGTPEGKSLPRGEDIPLTARILTIADAYDAMVSDRPYRKGRTQENAFLELRRCAGSQFDPQLVERFIQVITDRAMSKAAARAASEPEQVVATMQYELDRLTQALEAQDLSLVAALAGRLSASASYDGLGDVARLAHELEESATMHPDLVEVVSKMNDLIATCRSAKSPKTPSNPVKNGMGSWESFVEKVHN
jgi:diguanylate cyclase (GGDEF)-like protein/putative nucleotidyltransferase with HDIG domain